MATILYFALWAAVIFLMMRFGCGAHMMGHGHGGHGSSHDAAVTSGGPRWVPPERNTDPVCGMTVATKGAKSNVYNGSVYYFCSADCRDKFEASPTSFLARSEHSHSMEHHRG